MSEVLAPAARTSGVDGWRSFAGRALAHKGFVIGGVVALVAFLAAAFGPLLLATDPLQINVRARFHPPSAEFLFGTDHYGRDIFARVIHGARLSIVLGLMVVVATGLLGVLIGAVAGYFRRLDGYLMRVMDALMAFPSLMLAIAIAAALGSGILNVVIALSIAYAPRTARVVRAAVISVRGQEYVEAARLAGVTHARILWRHILPNSMAPLIVDLTFVFAYAILADAALSFLGVGPPPPTPSWGNIIAEGRDYVVEAPWITAFPGLVIAFTVLGLNLLGDGLRDVLDPRLKST